MRIVNPTVAVVVPCRNEAARIGALLDGLAGQTRVPDEIVIVDDRSTDGTADIVRVWTTRHAQAERVPVRIVTGPGRGPGPAMNAGIRATTAAVIMRMDGHAIPARDYLELSLEALRASDGGVGGVGVVGGVWDIRPGADTSVGRAIAAVVSHPLGSGGAAYRSPSALGPERTSVETVPFGTFRRTVWERLDGFDESLEANQDFDFNYRARQAGFDVVLDRRIVATYFARPTVRALMRQYFRYGYWKARMLRKDLRAIRWRQVPPALLVPWVLGTLGAAILAPAAATGVAVALYPLVVVAGGIHISVTRKVSPLAAAAAVAVVHLSWSAGFCRGVTTQRQP